MANPEPALTLMLLEAGDNVRYRGLGAGLVVRLDERKFQGQPRVFAVIRFPHRDMTVQLPVGDPVVARRLERVLPESDCWELLALLDKPGHELARTWDKREEQGTAILKKGGPREWALLLQSYASARRAGLSVASSDADIVRGAEELLAAELCASSALPYAEAFTEVHGRYQRGAAGGKHSRSKQPA